MSALNFWDGTQWVTLNTTGATGPQGPRGDKGDTGAPGQDGISINILGSVEDPVDLPATPNAGDAFIYADAASPLNGNLLVFTPGATGLDIGGSPSEWVVGGRIVGPAGADGAPGADGQGFTYKGEFVAGPDYDNYDVVTFNGASYVQIAAPSSTNDTPDLDPTAWQLLASGGADGAEGPRGPNCYVQTAEPVAGGVGELWIDTDAVVADAEPCLPLKGGTLSGNVVFDTARQTAGDNKEIICRGGGVAGSPSSYWGLEVNPDDNANITYCVGVAVGKKTSNEAAGLSGYGIVSDIDGPSSYAIWARGTAPSRFVGNVTCASDLTVTGNITAGKGAISGDAVGFPVVYQVLDADHTLEYSPSTAGRKDRRLECSAGSFIASAAGLKIRIPTSAAAAFPIGWEVVIMNSTAVALTYPQQNRVEIVADAGVTVRYGTADDGYHDLSADRLRVRNNYGIVRLLKVNANSWQAYGDCIKVV